MKDELDLLIATRTGGAVNIRGVRYQILFSVLKSLEMFCDKETSTYVRLEGIEDVDLIGLHNQFIQVKTAKDPWKWSQLKEPVQRFLEVHRNDRNASFILHVDFPLKGDIARLAAYRSLNARDQIQVRKHFVSLCKTSGASAKEAASLLAKLSIQSLLEKELLIDLRGLITKAFGLGTNAVDIYLLALVAQHLAWSKERKTVFSSDIADFWLQIRQDLGREEEFQAVGKGLIDELSWTPDANLADFLDGKGTRPGHIAGNLDVLRPYWLDRIDEALQSMPVCVIRGSSGQGKSTLLYRFAHDRWPEGQVLSLNAVHTLEQVQTVRNHLELRVRLGHVPLVLIDNIGVNTRYWSEVSGECARLGVRVLASIRQEDWGRFVHRSATNYELVEPYLNLVEARQVFEALSNNGRIDSSVDSAEQSFEQIGSPPLFMEFISLITQGRMLEERLQDQVDNLKQLGEDPAKVELIRRVTLAHTLGVSLLTEPLMDGLSFAKEDPGQALLSLLGEYLSANENRVTGLHQVRSGHLVHLLHDGYPTRTQTAIACIPLVPITDMQVFVANVLASSTIDPRQFEKHLIAWMSSQPLEVCLQVLDGYFEAGERMFLHQIYDLFDDVFKRGGENLLFVVRSELLPTVRVDILSTMINALGERGQELRDFQERLSTFRELPRGIDRVRQFLGNAQAEIDITFENTSLATIGRFLDWCSLTNTSIPYWSEFRNKALEIGEGTWSSVQAVAQFAQGLYRYDQDTYAAWLAANRQLLIEYLEFELDCLHLRVGDDIITVTFLVEPTKQLSPNEAAVTRLNQLRSIFPFAEEYQSRGEWILRNGLTPSIDETIKNIPRRNLHLGSDVAKNVAWGNIIEARYVLSSYYQVLQSWHTHRQLALQIVKSFIESLGSRRATNGVLPIDLTPSAISMYTDFEKASRHIPSLPPQASTILKDDDRKIMTKWTNSFQIFLTGLL